MKNLKLHKLLCLLLIFTFLPAFSSLADNGKIDKSQTAQNQIIVKYKDDAKKESTKNKLKTKKKVKEVKVKDKVKLKEKNKEKEAELLEFSPDADLDAMLQELKNDPNVELAEPNYMVTSQRDPGYSSQWGLKNSGQVIFGQEGYDNYDIKIEAARNLTQGSPDILVAVVDSGMRCV